MMPPVPATLPFRLLLVAVLCAVFPLQALGAAPATTTTSSPESSESAEILTSCTGRNLMSEARIVAAPAIDGIPDLARDSRVASEGGRWDSSQALRFASASAVLVFDLGAPRTLRSALVQADADDTYLLEGSLDGAEFRPLGRAAPLPTLAGLRTRAVAITEQAARFVRIRPVGGDGRASLSELQLFCTPVGEWELSLVSIAVDEQPARPGRWPGWNDVSSRWWQLALALAAIVFVVRAPRSGLVLTRRWSVAYATAFALAFLTYLNFGLFHFTNFVHNWDTFHYFVGAKYFPELGYDGLYDCVAVADARSGNGETRGRAVRRTIRDLRTNELIPASTVLDHPESCTSRFSTERFDDFQRDVAWFRERESADRWDELSADHGFNASPVWMIAGSTLANLTPATDRSIPFLAGLDLLYFAGLAAVLVWGFGGRAATVAMLVLATSFPSRFFWTGGSFLRWDWLFFLAAALALARRQRPLAGGLCLGYSALLRLFPLLLAVGPAIVLARAAYSALRNVPSGARRPALATAFRADEGRASFRFLAGMALFAALALPVSALVTGAGAPSRGIEAWQQFLHNTGKHSRTPLTNNMGLATALTFRPSAIGRVLHDESAPEPWARWKSARLTARQAVRPLQLGLALAALVAVGLGAVRERQLWIALALAAAWIPFALEMTSYYFAFLVIPALLWKERRAVGILLLALSAFGQFLSLAPLSGMPTWRDEIYSWLSIATLLALSAVLLLFVRRQPNVPPPSASCLNLR